MIDGCGRLQKPYEQTRSYILLGGSPDFSGMLTTGPADPRELSLPTPRCALPEAP